MRPLTCEAAERRLQAFHDGELSVQEQIEVLGHLDICALCADVLSDLQCIGGALRTAARRQNLLSHDESATFAADVVSRHFAEDKASLLAMVREMFDDMHLVYAGLGAAVASVACAVIVLGMMQFAQIGHRNTSPSASLAALMTLAATPETSANFIATDAASHARGSARFQAASETAAEDAVFELASVVTRQGRLVNLARLKTGHKATRDEAKAIESLLESVTRASIETGWNEGAPLAGDGMVWFVTRMTVRASKASDVDLPLPPAKTKRIARTAGLASIEL
jgi:hypothetical protein